MPPIKRLLRSRVAVVGHLCVDIKPAGVDFTKIVPGRLLEGGPLAVMIGGAVANTGRVLASLGVPSQAYGAVGHDVLGDYIVSELGQWPGLACDIDRAEGVGTSYTLVIEPEGVDRAFWSYAGANAAFDGAGVVPDGLDVLHLGYPPLMPALYVDGGGKVAELFARARSCGVTTSLDMAVVDRSRPVGALDWRELLRSWGPLTDVFSPSFDDMSSALNLNESCSEESLSNLGEELLSWGFGVVCLSAGSEGFWLGAADSTRFARAGRVLAGLSVDWASARTRVRATHIEQPRTTTGAGDAATAGLLAAIIRGLAPTQAVELARDVASAVICCGGAGEFIGEIAMATDCVPATSHGTE